MLPRLPRTFKFRISASAGTDTGRSMIENACDLKQRNEKDSPGNTLFYEKVSIAFKNLGNVFVS